VLSETSHDTEDNRTTPITLEHHDSETLIISLMGDACHFTVANSSGFLSETPDEEIRNNHEMSQLSE